MKRIIMVLGLVFILASTESAFADVTVTIESSSITDIHFRIQGPNNVQIYVEGILTYSDGTRIDKSLNANISILPADKQTEIIDILKWIGKKYNQLNLNENEHTLPLD